MIRKALKFLLWLLVLLILIVAGVITYATASNSGLRQTLELGKKFAPGKLDWVSADGSWTSPLSLKEVNYQQENGLSLRLSSLEMRWLPGELLSRKFLIQKLHMDGIEIKLPAPDNNTNTESTQAVSLPQVQLPLDIEIEDLSVGKINVYPHGADNPIVIDNVHLVSNAGENGLQISRFDVSTPEANVAVKGKLQMTQNYPLDMQLDWDYKHKQFGQFSGKGTLIGDLDKLAVKHLIKGAVNLELDSTVQSLLDNPGWDARLTAKAVSLDKISDALNNTPLDVSLNSRGNLDHFELDADLISDLAQTGPLNVTLSAQGDTQKLHIDHTLIQLLSRPGKIHFNGDIDIAKQSLDVKGDWQQLSWPIVSKPYLVETPQGSFNFQGSAKEFTANLNANLSGEQFGIIDTVIDAKGKDDRLILKGLDVSSPQSPLQLKAVAEFDMKKQYFTSMGEWKNLAWPLNGNPMINSQNGDFAAKGLLNDYTFNLNAELEGKDVPEGNWKLEGSGDDKQIRAFSLFGSLLGGEVEAKGTTAWTPQVSWNIDLSGRDIDPGKKWPEVPGNLEVDISSVGTMGKKGPEIEAVINHLAGQLKNQPLNGTGQIKLVNEELNIDRLDLSSGNTQLTANGVLGQQWNLDWNIQSPDLSALLPGLSGSVKGTGNLSGTAKSPQAKADIEVNKLKSGANRIGSLSGNLTVDLSGKSKSQIRVDGSQLQLAGQQWEKLKVSGTGKPSQHQLQIDLSGPVAQLNTRLKGAMANESWKGQLLNLSAKNTAFGDWTLKKPSPINASAEKANAGEICLQSQPSEICLRGNWSASKGSKGLLTLSQIRPERFKQFIPEGLKINTSVDGKIDARVDNSGKINAKSAFTLASGDLVVDTGEKPVKVETGKGAINANINGNKADSAFTLDLGQLGKLEADMDLRNIFTKPTMSGKLKTNIDDLSVISSFAPQLQEVEGQFSADLDIKGKMDSPSVHGRLELTEFAAEVPEVAIKIEKTQFSAQSQGSGPLILDGKSNSGNGELNLAGKLEPSSRTLELQLNGDQFEVANSEQIQAQISPNLDIVMNEGGMTIKGEVVIPRAYINANGGNSGIETVNASGDVIIVETSDEEETEKPGSNITLDVNIVLGDDITVEAGDFRGALKGSLKVEQTPELAPRGTGTIEVVNGDYVIYGQQLNMQRGRILFSGGPVDNPQLDMDVARNVEAYEVVAGAKIRGTAQAPLLQLYSEPSMPDASILSYILLGQPPGTKGGSYTLGKYLTPDLYVSYGIGLFDAINTFNMRYKLTEKFAVQAASSTASSADLIYTIEK